MAFLIARPDGKAQQTAAFFEQHLLHAQALPLLSILVSCDPLNVNEFNKAEAKTIIVTSTYAAQWLLDIEHKSTINLSDVIFICVGASTAEMLRPFSKHTEVLIARPENSEGVVLNSRLQNVVDMPVVILKGEGGRDLIANTLLERGAKVSTLNVYKRVVNDSAINAFTFEASQITCIIVTSIEIGQLLLANISQKWLASCTWIVASQRIKDYANKHGIQQIMVSQGASNHALLACAKKSVNTGVAHD